MGGNYYCRASGNAVFEVNKPNLELGIGVDGLPEAIRNSNVLTGNNLGILGNYTAVPAREVNFKDEHLDIILAENTGTDEAIHTYARQLIEQNEVNKAWQVLLSKNHN